MRADQIVRDARGDASIPAPDLTALSEFLSVPDRPETYRIDQIMLMDADVLLVAQKKIGKSTLVSNFVRSLVDNEPFLGRFGVTPLEPGRSVVHFDNELGEDNLRRWLREQKIQGTDRVYVADLRGRLATFNILNPEIRAEWADKLRAANAQVIIFDCLRPALDALGMSEDKEASRFAQALTALKIESGASDLLLVHHAGHDASRARGDSALSAWCTDEWKMRLESQDNPFSPRVFSAFGRSAGLASTRLDYDPLTRRLSLADTTVVAAKVNSNIEVVREAVEHSPGMNSTQLRKALGAAGMTSGGDRSTAMREAREQGLIVRVKSGRENVFYPPSAAEVMWLERADGEETDDVDQVA
nr:AAA family ATPase [Microbacterium aurum]